MRHVSQTHACSCSGSPFFSLFRVLVARMVRARSWDGTIKSEFVVCEAAAVAVCSVCYILQYRVRKRCGSLQHQTWFAFQCDRVSSSCVRGVEWSICRRRAPVRLDFRVLQPGVSRPQYRSGSASQSPRNCILLAIWQRSKR